MIITLTPNPTIDRVYYLPSLQPDTVHRSIKEVASPSGKGIDVSVILRLFDVPTVALGFNAGPMGKILADYLDELDVAYDFVSANGETRTVPILADQATGQEYTITAPTLSATPQQFEQLLARIAHHGASGWGLVAAGSLPPGVPAAGYAQIISRAKEAGLTTLLDTSGASLRHGIAGLPHILKVNQMELAEINADFADFAEQITNSSGRPAILPEYAQALSSQLGTLASDAIVISMGTRGVLSVTADGATYAGALNVPVKVTTGAGDAMDTGIMLARMRGEGWQEGLRLGTAMAAAAVMHEATAGLDLANVEKLLPQVEVEQL